MYGDYPPFGFDQPYAMNLAVGMGPVRRLAVFFRLVLVVPMAVVGIVVSVGFGLSSFVVWLIVLIRGAMPPALFDAVAAIVRFHARLNAYLYMLTSKYPGELFGDRRGFGPPGGYGAPTPYGGYGAPTPYGGAAPYGGPSSFGVASSYGASAPYGAPISYGAPAPYGAPVAPPYGAAPPDTQAVPPAPQFLTPPPAPAAGGTTTTPTGPTDPSDQTETTDPTDTEVGEPTSPPQSTYPSYWSSLGVPDVASAPPPTGPPAGGPPSSAQPFTAPSPTASSPAVPPPTAPPPTGPPASFPPPGSRSQVGPLVLSKRSKRILLLFVLLGVIGYGTYFTVIPVTLGSIAGLASNTSLIDAHDQLANTLSTIEQQQASCAKTDLTCVQRGDKELADAFASFADTEQSLTFPSSEQAAAATLQNNTRTFVALLDRLSTDGLTQYASDESSLEADASNFDSAYQAWLDTTP